MKIVNQIVSPEGLFVPSKEPIGGHEEDLSTPPSAQAVVKRMLTRLYDLDFTKVEISGVIGRRAKQEMAVALFEGDNVTRDFTFDSCYPGNVHVRAKEGFELGDAIQNDLIGKLQTAWMAAWGNDSDHPCAYDIQISKDGKLSIELDPLY